MPEPGLSSDSTDTERDHGVAFLRAYAQPKQPSRNRLTKQPRELKGRTQFSRHFWKTDLPRYTNLYVPGGRRVLLLHEYELTKDQEKDIADTIVRARQDVRHAIRELSKGVGNLDSNTYRLLQDQFRVGPGKLSQWHVDAIRERMCKIAEGLNSPNFQIKITDGLSVDENYRVNTTNRDPKKQIGGLAQVDFLDDPSQRVSVRLNMEAARDPTYGSDLLINMVGLNAAHLFDYGDKGYSVRNESGRSGPYLKDGLRPHQALENADTYAAFCGDLRRCEEMDLTRAPPLTRGRPPERSRPDDMQTRRSFSEATLGVPRTTDAFLRDGLLEADPAAGGEKAAHARRLHGQLAVLEKDPGASEWEHVKGIMDAFEEEIKEAVAEGRLSKAAGVIGLTDLSRQRAIRELDSREGERAQNKGASR